ncbi:MAG: alpha/beta fold hydrolase [Mycobacteriales bacterium]
MTVACTPTGAIGWDDRQPTYPALPSVDGVRHRWVDTPRLRIHVAEAGAGEPLVLLHGWPQHWYAWRSLIPLLAGDFRVICPDLRGFGWTDVPRTGYATADFVADVEGLLDALDVRRVFLAGHDVGARVGFGICLSNPARVRRFVALGGLHPYWQPRLLAPQAWRYWWTPLVETPLLGRWVVAHLPGYVRMLLRRGLADSNAVTGADIDTFVTSLRAPARARASEALMRTFAYREIVPTLLGRYRAHRLTVPTLMLNGTRDFALSPRSLGGYQDYADDLRLELLPGTGHHLAEECPATVARWMREFFADDVGR